MANNHAIIIGINDYSMVEGYPNLKYACSDAENVSECLKVFCGYTVNHLGDTTKGATKSEIEQGISASASLPEVETLLFYYAGHGIERIADNSVELVPSDSSEKSSGTVSLVSILQTLSSSKAKSIIVCLDCCRHASAAPLSRGTSIGESSIKTTLQIASVKLTQTPMAIIFACSGMGTAFEQDPIKSGIFSHSFCCSLAASYGAKVESNAFIQKVAKVQKQVCKKFKLTQTLKSTHINTPPEIYISTRTLGQSGLLPPLKLQLKYAVKHPLTYLPLWIDSKPQDAPKKKISPAKKSIGYFFNLGIPLCLILLMLYFLNWLKNLDDREFGDIIATSVQSVVNNPLDPEKPTLLQQLVKSERFLPSLPDPISISPSFEGIVTHFRFDSNFEDSSGFSNHAYGDNLPETHPGKSNACAYFTKELEAIYFRPIPFKEQISIAFWIHPLELRSEESFVFVSQRHIDDMFGTKDAIAIKLSKEGMKLR